MASNSNQSSVQRIFKKIVRIIIISLTLILLLFFYWKFYFTYSEGYRAGLLQKFSNKGTIFKTYEGEMILSSVTSTRNVALASEKFLFSVSDELLASKLDTLQGQFLIVHYRQKNSKLPWRGDSSYIVDSVKVKN